MTGIIGMTARVAAFDERKILEPYRRERRRWLFRTGGKIRTIARRSMKRRKSISAPGEPPHAHEGGLKNLMRFAVEQERVVIGPLPHASKVAAELEHGGVAYVRDRRGRRRQVAIRPRPFMRPALQTAAPDLPTGWRGVVR